MNQQLDTFLRNPAIEVFEQIQTRLQNPTNSGAASGLQIADCGLRIDSNLQSTIRPQEGITAADAPLGQRLNTLFMATHAISSNAKEDVGRV